MTHFERVSADDVEDVRRMQAAAVDGNYTSPRTRVTCVGRLWAIVSLLAAVSSAVSLLAPYWLLGTLTVDGRTVSTSFGVFRRCNYPAIAVTVVVTPETSFDDLQMLASRREKERRGGRAREEGGDGVMLVGQCGHYASLAAVPSIWWRMASVTMTAGCLVAGVIGVVLIIGCCLDDVLSPLTCRLIGLLQFFSGFFILVSLCLYPLGWGNPEIVEACGSEAGVFNAGTCHIGWSLFTALVSSSVLILTSLCSCSAVRSINYIKLQHQLQHHSNDVTISEVSLSQQQQQQRLRYQQGHTKHHSNKHLL